VEKVTSWSGNRVPFFERRVAMIVALPASPPWLTTVWGFAVMVMTLPSGAIGSCRVQVTSVTRPAVRRNANRIALPASAFTLGAGSIF